MHTVRPNVILRFVHKMVIEQWTDVQLETALLPLLGQSGCWHNIKSKVCFVRLQDIASVNINISRQGVRNPYGFRVRGVVGGE